MDRTGTILPYLEKVLPYINNVKHPSPRVLLTSAFFTGNQQSLLYQEIQI